MTFIIPIIETNAEHHATLENGHSLRSFALCVVLEYLKRVQGTPENKISPYLAQSVYEIAGEMIGQRSDNAIGDGSDNAHQRTSTNPSNRPKSLA